MSLGLEAKIALYFLPSKLDQLEPQVELLVGKARSGSMPPGDRKQRTLPCGMSRKKASKEGGYAGPVTFST